MVSTTLRDIFGDDNSFISDNDFLCYNCYKHHLQIFKSEHLGSDNCLENDIKLWTMTHQNTTDKLGSCTCKLMKDTKTIPHTIRPMYNKDVLLQQAGKLINKLILDEIHTCAIPVDDPLQLHITNYMDNINPELVAFIQQATKSETDNKYTKGKRDEKDNTVHVQKLHVFFTLTMLMYMTNKKPMVIHNLLADVVEVCGGSRTILRILNRLGCVSSPDTHDRFVTSQAKKQRNTELWTELSDKVLSIPSTDNFLCSSKLGLSLLWKPTAKQSRYNNTDCSTITFQCPAAITIHPGTKLIYSHKPLH